MILNHKLELIDKINLSGNKWDRRTLTSVVHILDKKAGIVF